MRKLILPRTKVHQQLKLINVDADVEVRSYVEMKQKQRKLSKVGRNSIGIILPSEILKQLNWRKHQNVLVKKAPRGIMIIDAPTKHNKKKL